MSAKTYNLSVVMRLVEEYFGIDLDDDGKRVQVETLLDDLQEEYSD